MQVRYQLRQRPVKDDDTTRPALDRTYWPSGTDVTVTTEVAGSPTRLGRPRVTA